MIEERRWSIWKRTPTSTWAKVARGKSLTDHMFGPIIHGPDTDRQYVEVVPRAALQAEQERREKVEEERDQIQEEYFDQKQLRKDLCGAAETRIGELEGALRRLRRLADEQAEDEGLWANTINAQTAYVQQGLRHLHSEIEQEIVALSQPKEEG